MTSKMNPFTGLPERIGVPRIVKAAAPTTADYQYPLGQEWVDTAGTTLYFLASVSGTTATWEKVIGGSTGLTSLGSDSGSATPSGGSITITGGTNVNTSGAGAAITVNVDASPTFTTVKATTFDTNIAAAGVTLAGTSLIADGTDAAINITLTPKGSGAVILDGISYPIADSTAGHCLITNGATVLSLGVLGVVGGGSGAATLTGVLTGNGTSAISANTVTQYGVIVAGASNAVASLTVATNGQVLVGGTTANPAFHTLTSSDSTIAFTTGSTTLSIQARPATTSVTGVIEQATDAETQLLADTARAVSPSNVGALLAPQKNSGFQEWTGAGSYYTINTQDFVLDRPGIGWINNVKVTWAGAQTEAALSKGATHYIYIDSAGTIGSTTTRSTALFQDNIVLFQALVDNDTPANVIVVKENHSMMINPQVMEFCHDIGLHGFNVTEEGSGGVIAVHGTLGIQVIGNTEWLDHDLETDVPDSAAAAIDMHVMYEDGGGKSILSAIQATVPTQYNNAGTLTNLTGNQRAISCVYVGKDDIESAAPHYFLEVGDVLYNSLAGANTALANDQFTTPTSEMLALEMILMGCVVVNATTIDSVTSQKQTIGTGTSISTGGSANLVSVDVTNFNGILSATDTTVQVALETIDDMGDPVTVPHGGSAAVTLTGVLTGNGTSAFTANAVTQYGVIVAGASNAVASLGVAATGTVMIGNTGANPSFSASPTLTSVLATTFDTNVAAAGVTLVGTSLIADGTDVAINIILTPKGTGVFLTEKIGFAADTTAILLTAAGEVTKPLQPLVIATANNVADVTGNNTIYTMTFPNIVANIGSNFDGTSTFTAPVTHYYRIYGGVQINNTQAGTTCEIKVVTSNRTYKVLQMNPSNFVNSGNGFSYNWCVLADMDATDTATMTIVINGIGADTADYRSESFMMVELA